MGKTNFSPAMSISDLLDSHPLIPRVFIKMGLACIGCPMNRFCTVDDLPKYYDLDWNQFNVQILPLVNAP